MILNTVIIRKRDGTTEEMIVCYGACVRNVFPDGSIVEEVKTGDNLQWEPKI
jgi:hypothetical protein